MFQKIAERKFSVLRVHGAIMAALFIGLALAIFSYDKQIGLFEWLYASTAGRVLLWVAQGLFAINALALVWRLWLVSRYRAEVDVDDEALPEITVVVPAYNEGRQVMATLQSIVSNDYPANKMHIVAVDDGSKDDTWKWICRGAAAFPGRIETLRCVENRGKREALAEGFRRSTGTVLVTVDSDSILETRTLRALVSPFVGDARVGAIAGNVRVLNRDAGVIPRMVDTFLTAAFDFTRASHSAANCVVCCPGALSAYRRDIALKAMPGWLAQTFLGRPATTGEDRAMTNEILRSGYDVRYQRSAVSYADMPTTYSALTRMYLRWARSGVRESLTMASYVFTNFRDDTGRVRSGKWASRINSTLELLGLSVAQLLRVPVLLLFFMSPFAVGSQLAIGAIMMSILPALTYVLVRRSSRGLWAFPYGILAIFGLWWIVPVALVTPHKMGWLTREMPLAPAGSRIPQASRVLQTVGAKKRSASSVAPSFTQPEGRLARVRSVAA